MINIIVCMKQVIDPEAPVSLFHVDTQTMRALPPKGTPPVLSPFDENALEAALKIKGTQEAKITVLSMGRKLAKPILKTTLAAGADQLILLEDEAFTDFDSNVTANILALAIKKIGTYDLVLCGIQAADTNAGQVGPGIAEILGIPNINIARKIEVRNGGLKVERVLSYGTEEIEASLPAVVTTSNEIGDLREPNVQALMAAATKPVIVWNAQLLGLPSEKRNRTSIVNLYQPVHQNKCQMISGGSPEESAVNLALKLKENKIL
jgi:electron transfer flavoprotein beta subunit